MDEFEAVSLVLRSIASMNELLVRHAQAVKKMPDVIAVSQRIDFRDYKTGPFLEAYVDAELESDSAICWWLQLELGQDEWLLEASVRLNTAEGQQTLWEAPALTLNRSESLSSSLIEAARKLTSLATLRP